MKRSSSSMQAQRAFTLVELLIVIALVAIVASLAGPSMYGFVLVQRLKGINASLVTDLQYARSEAVARGKNVWVVLMQIPASQMTCYTIYTDQDNTVGGRDKCDCTQAPASRCAASATELKTVQVPSSLAVRLRIDTTAFPHEFAFDPITGGIFATPSDVSLTTITPPAIDTLIDGSRTLRTRLVASGRPVVCLPPGSSVSGGYPAC